METQRAASTAHFHQRLIQNLVQTFAAPKSWPKGALSVPKFQAHRGFWLAGERENTIGAFVAAAHRGATMIELDVRLTQDQVVVVFHDERTGRFSDLNQVVRELTYRQLKDQIADLATLDQVLTHSQVPAKLNIECKTESIIEESLERRVFEIVKNRSALDRVLISSFNPFSIWRMSQLTDRLPLALLVGDDSSRPYLREMWTLPLVSAHLLHVNQDLISAQFLAFWMKKGFPISVWTVNEKEKALKLLSQGCLSIISDQLV